MKNYSLPIMAFAAFAFPSLTAAQPDNSGNSLMLASLTSKEEEASRFNIEQVRSEMVKYSALNSPGHPWWGFEPEPIRGLHFAAGAGAWLYSGNMATLQMAPMPCLNFALGLRANKITFDVAFNLLSATNPGTFVVRNNDSLLLAHYTIGAYTGLNLEYQLLRSGRSEIDCLAGGGLTTFGYSDGQQQIVFSSPDLNAGLGYRFYLHDYNRNTHQANNYLALQAKYHVLNFSNPGGTPMDGNAVSVSLEYGGYSHNSGNNSYSYHYRGHRWRGRGFHPFHSGGGHGYGGGHSGGGFSHSGGGGHVHSGGGTHVFHFK